MEKLLAFSLAFLLLLAAIPAEDRAEYRIPLAILVGMVCAIALVISIKADKPIG